MKDYRIGEIARLTGLSIRTLRYYDEIGLLSPSSRSEAGHRLYSEDDIARLQKILSLRQIGSSLEEISALLEQSQTSVLSVLELQLARLHEEMELRSTLLDRLESVAGYLRQQQDVPVDELIKLIEGTVMIDKYYTKEQQEYLKQRADAIGPEAINNAENEWAQLIEDVRTEMKSGASPDSETVQELARHWMDLIQQFTGGDTRIEHSLKQMYQEEGPERASRGTLDAEVAEFMDKAIARMK